MKNERENETKFMPCVKNILEQSREAETPMVEDSFDLFEVTYKEFWGERDPEEIGSGDADNLSNWEILNVYVRNLMKVEEMLSIAPRKALLVVRVKNERFLIASDAEETRLISRLEGSELQFEQEEFENKVEGLNTLYKKRDLFREEPIKDKIPRETFVEREVVTYDKKPPMMRELLRKLGK